MYLDLLIEGHGILRKFAGIQEKNRLNLGFCYGFITLCEFTCVFSFKPEMESSLRLI